LNCRSTPTNGVGLENRCDVKIPSEKILELSGSGVAVTENGNYAVEESHGEEVTYVKNNGVVAQSIDQDTPSMEIQGNMMPEAIEMGNHNASDSLGVARATTLTDSSLNTVPERGTEPKIVHGYVTNLDHQGNHGYLSDFIGTSGISSSHCNSKIPPDLDLDSDSELSELSAITTPESFPRTRLLEMPPTTTNSDIADHVAVQTSTDIILAGVREPGTLGNKILRLDGRITHPPHGNAWKDFRCYRNNQDMGSLWEVRQAWFVRRK